MSGLLLTGVDHAFGPVEVLSNIDLRLDPGEIVALIGPSGCGKSTLLNLCAGLLYPRSGRVENGFATQACMFQRPRLLPWKTALANIGLGLAAAGTGRVERDRRARELGHRLGLDDRDLACFPHQLSGGMQSRVALARALAIDPPLLLLDEPFSALDIGLKEELYALLLEHVARRSPAALIVTHDLAEALRLSDRILAMAPEPGRIVGRFQVNAPRQARDASWVHRNTAALLAEPAIRLAFGLPENKGETTPQATSLAEPFLAPQSGASIVALPVAAGGSRPGAGPRC